MFERLERPLKIICAGLAALLVLQLGALLWRGDPLAHLKIPALPSLPESTNETAKLAKKETVAAAAKKTGTNNSSGTNAVTATNSANSSNAPTVASTTNGTNAAKTTNAMVKAAIGQMNPESPDKPPGLPSGMTPEMMAGMPPGITAQMGGGMPGGRRGGGMKKVDLPPEVQARVDRIINSEILGPRIHPMPMALIGISDQEAYIRGTNGQTGPVKVGGEIGGVKLLRIGINRVLVEQDGEKRELNLFNGLGGESLMPQTNNGPATNASSTNAPAKKPARRSASPNQILSSPPKEAN